LVFNEQLKNNKKNKVMNKTVNINLGGIFFHIDEDAFQKLTRYFDAIKRSLSSSSGQEEIIHDIEMRIAELISAKHTSDKQVISLKEVDEIIAVMGQPEDYRIDDESTDNAIPFSTNRKTKKLYRDSENKVIGGVASGLGHYFGVSSSVFKALFLLFFFAGFGTGVIAYLVLWFVVPEALTTSEKIEMKGESVTISNIEKKVREEFETMSDKIKNVDGSSVGVQAQSAADTFLSVLTKLVKGLSKIIGIVIVAYSAITLFGITVMTLVLTLTSSMKNTPWENAISAFVNTDMPFWAIILLGFLALAIPYFFFLRLGLKIISNRVKPMGSIPRFTLIGVWIIAVLSLVYFGLTQVSEYVNEGKVIAKQTIVCQPTDTLHVEMRSNPYYVKDFSDHEDFEFTQDSTGTGLIYSNNVRFRIVRTEQTAPYLQIEKSSRGKTVLNARKRADKISYTFEIKGNRIILDDYLLTQLENKYRGQEVEVFLYLPEGMFFSPDKNIRYFDASYESDYNLKLNSDNEVYKMTNKDLICLNCKADEDLDGNVKKITTVKVNGDEFFRTEVKETWYGNKEK
jgi:phage shock protein PspC (stress-responsive transcriptional regulator)